MGGAGGRSAHACSYAGAAAAMKRWLTHWATFWSWFLWVTSSRMDFQAFRYIMSAKWSTELNIGMGKLRSDHNGWQSRAEKRWLRFNILSTRLLVKYYIIHRILILIGCFFSWSWDGWDPAPGTVVHLPQKAGDIRRLSPKFPQELNWPHFTHTSQSESKQLCKHYNRWMKHQLLSIVASIILPYCL